MRTNKNTPYQNQKRTKTDGTASNKITGGLSTSRPILTLCSALGPDTLSCLVCVEDS